MQPCTPTLTSAPARTEPSDSWPHKKLWRGVIDALKALPAHFHSDTFIEGVNATDVFTLNSALGATIENQVVETLNTIRSVWDPDNRYGTYLFVRQPQSFPDVVLKIFHQDATDAQIRGALERLRKKAEAIAESSQKKSFLHVLSVLEAHYQELT